MTHTATFYSPKGGGDITWRAEWPAECVGGRVAKIDADKIEDAVGFPNTHTGMPWRLLAAVDDGTHILDSRDSWKAFTETHDSITSLTAQFPEHEGVAVFTRPCLGRATLAKAMRLQGIRTVAETDDNYFSAAHLNLFARTQGTSPESYEMHAKAMASMGVNVFSTQWLLDRYHKDYRKRFGKKGLPEMHVARNHVPLWAWPEKKEYDGPIRFGFMGSSSHVWDVNLAYASFHAAKFHGCHTVMIGYNPAEPDPDIPEEITADGVVYKTRTDKSLAVSRQWQTVVDEHIRWIDPGSYHRASLPLDIGVCPLLSDDFTFGRSDSKALEYTINGAAIIAQKHPVYTRSGWEHEVNCLLGSSQEELALQTLRLIHDPLLRTELVKNAQEMVRTERTEVQMRDEWNVALGV